MCARWIIKEKEIAIRYDTQNKKVIYLAGGQFELIY